MDTCHHPPQVIFGGVEVEQGDIERQVVASDMVEERRLVRNIHVPCRTKEHGSVSATPILP